MLLVSRMAEWLDGFNGWMAGWLDDGGCGCVCQLNYNTSPVQYHVEVKGGTLLGPLRRIRYSENLVTPPLIIASALLCTVYTCSCRVVLDQPQERGRGWMFQVQGDERRGEYLQHWYSARDSGRVQESVLFTRKWPTASPPQQSPATGSLSQT